jgi:hypothetical protein
MNGQVSAADVRKQTADATTVALVFEPYQSHIIVFTRQASALSTPRVHSGGHSTIDLNADWSVTFGQGPAQVFKTLHSWEEDDATRYFSGVATYEKYFDLPENSLVQGGSAVLDFGDGTPLDVQPTRNGMQTWYDAPIREAAVIYVNGQRAGSLWCPPYRLDVTGFLKAGRNQIRLVVGNTALNYLAGHKLPDYKLLNLRYGERFQAQDMDKIRPLPSGLIGTPKLSLSN